MREDVREIDLTAYADGLLDGDPVRRSAVEAFLAENPEAAERVRRDMRQNEAIRATYAHRMEEAIPERLTQVLERRRGLGGGGIARIAASVTVAAVAGVAGWWIGQGGGEERESRYAFLDRAASAFVAGDAVAARDAASAKSESLSWLSERVALELRAPDLAPLGATLVDKRLISEGGQEIAELVYLTGEGERFSLFLRARWQEKEPGIELVERHGVVTAYWREGPLAYALVGSLDRATLAGLADDIRAAAVREPRVRPSDTPQVTVQGAVPGACDGAAGAMEECPALLPVDAAPPAEPAATPVTAN